MAFLLFIRRLQGVVVHIHQQRAFPAPRQQGCGRAAHGHVENAGGINLLHGTAVIGQDRQETDELLHFLFRVGLVDVQAATVIGDLPQRPVRREVEDIALLLDDLLLIRRGTVGISDCPGRLHAEGRLEIRFRAGRIAQHENPGPWPDCYARGQFPAGQRDRLGLQRIVHRLLHGRQCRDTDPGGAPGRHNHLVIVIKPVLLLRQQVAHGMTRRHAWQKPECVRKHVQQPHIRKRHRRLLRAEFQVVNAGWHETSPGSNPATSEPHPRT